MTHFPLRRCFIVKSVYPAHLRSQCGYVEFHYAAQFGIICVHRGERVRFMGAHTLHRERRYSGFRDRSSRRIRHRIFAPRHKNGTTADLRFVSRLHRRRPTAMTKVYPEFLPGEQQIRDDSGTLDGIERQRGWSSPRSIARRVDKSMRRNDTSSALFLIHTFAARHFVKK